MKHLVIVVGILAFATSVVAQPRITLVGDSMVQGYDQTVLPGVMGWGQVLGEYMTPDVEILNHAMGGRSSKNFYNEGRWAAALATNPDYILIQFGHNDIFGKGPTHETIPDWPPAVLPETGLGSKLEDYYCYNIDRYVQQARAAGVVPVLVNSMERCMWRSFSVPDNRDSWIGGLSNSNEPWALAMVEVAEADNVPIVNLNAWGRFQYEWNYGPEGAKSLHYLQLDGVLDRTHFSPLGARFFAEEIGWGLRKIPELRPYVTLEPPPLPEPSAALVLFALPLLRRRK